ncbi:epimerase [Enterococcus faecalis X98]|nr:epimerase [Enterococcus faecalis X98]
MLLSDSKASSQFIINAVHKENIMLKSAGTQLYSYAYVADIVSALLFLLVKGQKGEAYNVSNEHCDITLRTFAETLANVAGTKVIHGEATAQEKQGFSKATKALLDNQKIYALGWRPLYDSMEEPLKHTIKILEGSGNRYAKN